MRGSVFIMVALTGGCARVAEMEPGTPTANVSETDTDTDTDTPSAPQDSESADTDQPADTDREQDAVDSPPDPLPMQDSDGDGIADHADLCPQEAEDLDGRDDEDGCPDPSIELNGQFEIVWSEQDAVSEGAEVLWGVAAPACMGDFDHDGVVDLLQLVRHPLGYGPIRAWDAARDRFAQPHTSLEALTDGINPDTEHARRCGLFQLHQDAPPMLSVVGMGRDQLFAWEASLGRYQAIELPRPEGVSTSVSVATPLGIGLGDLDRDGDDEVWFGSGHFLYDETGVGFYVIDWEDGSLVSRDWFDAPYIDDDTWFGMIYQPIAEDPSLRWVAMMGAAQIQGFQPGLWWEDRTRMGESPPSFLPTDFTPAWSTFELGVPPPPVSYNGVDFPAGATLMSVRAMSASAGHLDSGRDDDGDLVLDAPTWGACFVVAYVSSRHGVFCPSEVTTLQDPAVGPLVVLADHSSEADLAVPQVIPGPDYQSGHPGSSGWGVVIADLDADGHNDICIAHGEDEYFRQFPEHGYQQVHCWRNDGLARFDSLDSDDLGLTPIGHFYGLAAEDIDRDGLADLVVGGAHGTMPFVARNTAIRGHGLSLDLVSPASIDGAEVEVYREDGHVQRLQVRRSGSIHITPTGTVFAGLGEYTEALAVRVRWPGGSIERFGTLAAGHHQLVQGSGTLE